MRVLLSTCVVCLLGSRAFADDTLTLPQVIAAAVRASPDFERASLDVKAAEGAALAAQGIEDTHVGANASYNAVRDLSQQPSSPDHTRRLGGEVSIRKLFSTGTAITIAAGTEWNFLRIFLAADDDPARTRQVCDPIPTAASSCVESSFY